MTPQQQRTTASLIQNSAGGGGSQQSSDIRIINDTQRIVNPKVMQTARNLNRKQN